MAVTLNPHKHWSDDFKCDLCDAWRPWDTGWFCLHHQKFTCHECLEAGRRAC